MLLSLITASALALVVPIVAAIAWHTFVTRVELRKHQATTEALRSEISSLSARLSSFEQTKTPTALKAQLEDLAAAVEALSGSTRKQFGKVWGTIGAARSNGHDADDDADDDLQALLALQSAPTPPPRQQ